MCPKAEGVLNTYQKSVRRKEVGGGEKRWDETEGKKKLQFSQAGQSLGE